MGTPVPKPSQRGKRPATSAIARGMNEPPGNFTVSIDLLDHGTNPRVESDPARNAELADSIRRHGMLQPIRVRPVGGRYEIIAGNRRYEAAKVADLKMVPVIISSADDKTAYIESMVENVQRQDLDPIDKARGYRALIEMTGKTQKQVGELVGESQSAISNALALLSLQPEVQAQLQAGSISVGHAKVLAYLPPEKQVQLAKDTVERKLTVRDVESMASRQKADDQLAKERAEKAKKAAAEIVAFLESAKVAKDSLVVLYSQEAAAAANAAGWIAARPVEWKTDTTYPTYVCDCEALWVQTGEEFTTRKICIEKAHEKAAKTKATVAAKAKEKESDNAVDRARRAAQAALRIGPGQMSEDAIRLGLYALLMREESYGGNADRTRSAFVKRTGGEWPEFPNGGEGAFAIWEAVVGLNTADLVTEYLAVATAFVIPNVFTASAYANREHAAVRQWLVDQHGLDEAIVWGGKDSNGWDKVVPNKQVTDDKPLRLTPYEEAEVDSPVTGQLADGLNVHADGRVSNPSEPVPPTCDLCGEDEAVGDWNPETGCHISCEENLPDVGFSDEPDEVESLEVPDVEDITGIEAFVAKREDPPEIGDDPDLVEFDENVTKGEQAYARAEVDMATALAEAGLDKPLEVTIKIGPEAEEAISQGIEMALDPDEPDEEVFQTAQPLDGERVCVTGKIEGLDRDGVANAVVKAGGYFAESVNGMTTLLVVGDKPGASKVAAAKRFGTATITAAEFLARIGG